MELQGFTKFHQIVKREKNLASLGFESKVRIGDINRFASRVRLIKNFKGISLDGYTQDTTSGYNAFFIVFLTHSALERFMDIHSLKLDALSPLMAPYNPEKVIQEFVDKDRKGLLYDFLYQTLGDKKLKLKLSECRDLKSTNVAYISASIRHIFSHGHLCAHSNGINPKDVYSICTSTSNFLLNFMDAEFTKKIEESYSKVYTDSNLE